MPHVVYLHSALTQSRVVGRNDAERRKILKFEKVDVIIAMTLAGLVNMSMVIVAAGLQDRRPLRQHRSRQQRRNLVYTAARVPVTVSSGKNNDAGVVRVGVNYKF